MREREIGGGRGGGRKRGRKEERKEGKKEGRKVGREGENLPGSSTKRLDRLINYEEK